MNYQPNLLSKRENPVISLSEKESLKTLTSGIPKISDSAFYLIALSILLKDERRYRKEA